jgi:2-iminobutanoate/2-iminopropanoate deaminase
MQEPVSSAAGSRFLDAHLWNPLPRCKSLKQDRRKLLKGGAAVIAAAGVIGTGSAVAKESGKKKVYYGKGEKPEKAPLFSGAVSFGNLLFIAGKGAHFPGDIKSHTRHVLDEIEKELVNAGSSMEKVLKVNVYLNDVKDYDGMNEVYRGRFGSAPPVCTTIAAAGGVPGNSLVEIDCVAYI